MPMKTLVSLNDLLGHLCCLNVKLLFVRASRAITTKRRNNRIPLKQKMYAVNSNINSTYDHFLFMIENCLPTSTRITGDFYFG